MRRKLLKSEVAKIAEMLASGRTNAEVANYLNVSQATIYNQRTKLIREGLKLPELKRGRKPIKQEFLTNNAATTHSVKTNKKFNEYRFLINNVSVRISGKAKDVFVSEDEMRIIF